MHLSKTISELKHLLSSERKKGLSIGFVPTMGALHEGHLALLSTCQQQNAITVCSIFVNPAQFNNADDLKNYPRIPEQDIAGLERAGCQYLFMPEVSEMYRPGESLIGLEFGDLETTMEGLYRPGHFKGMATVVDKLIKIVDPDKAYFGEKDYQQLTIIRRMAGMLSYHTEIIACPTLREPDGLAMSSRNLLLTKEQRKAAPLIYKTIKAAGDQLKTNPVDVVKKNVIAAINENPVLEIQYFEIVHPFTLAPVTDGELPAEARGCIAVLTKGPRLIDNVAYHLKPADF